MPSAENQPERFNLDSEPADPSPLPPEVAELLEERPLAPIVNDEILFVSRGGATVEKVVKVSRRFVWTEMIASTDPNWRDTIEAGVNPLLRLSRNRITPVQGTLRVGDFNAFVSGVYRRSR